MATYSPAIGVSYKNTSHSATISTPTYSSTVYTVPAGKWADIIFVGGATGTAGAQVQAARFTVSSGGVVFGWTFVTDTSGGTLTLDVAGTNQRADFAGGGLGVFDHKETSGTTDKKAYRFFENEQIRFYGFGSGTYYVYMYIAEYFSLSV